MERNNKFSDDFLIESYFDRDLTDEEYSEFEQRCRSESFQNAYNDHLALRNAVRSMVHGQLSVEVPVHEVIVEGSLAETQETFVLRREDSGKGAIAVGYGKWVWPGMAAVLTVLIISVVVALYYRPESHTITSAGGFTEHKSDIFIRQAFDIAEGSVGTELGDGGSIFRFWLLAEKVDCLGKGNFKFVAWNKELPCKIVIENVASVELAPNNLNYAHPVISGDYTTPFYAVSFEEKEGVKRVTIDFSEDICIHEKFWMLFINGEQNYVELEFSDHKVSN